MVTIACHCIQYHQKEAKHCYGTNYCMQNFLFYAWNMHSIHLRTYSDYPGEETKKGGDKKTRPPETLKCSKSETCKARKLKLPQPVYLIRYTGWWSFSFLTLHVSDLENFKVSGGLVFLSPPFTLLGQIIFKLMVPLYNNMSYYRQCWLQHKYIYFLVSTAKHYNYLCHQHYGVGNFPQTVLLSNKILNYE